MLTKIKFSLLSKTYSKRTFHRIPKFYYLQRGYHANLKNSGYYELVKPLTSKSRNLIRQEEVFKSEEVVLLFKKKEVGIFRILREIVLVVIRVIVISTLVFSVFTLYWFTKLFGFKAPSVIYLKAIEYLGPAFIKLGQWMSTRRDLYSEDICTTLSWLQRYTPVHSWYYTREVLKAAYGPTWRQIFINFDKKPVGSGCCAQVHRALIDVDVYIGAINRDARASTLAEIAEFFYLGHVADFLGNIFEQNTECHDYSPSSSDQLTPVAVKILHSCVKERIERDLSILRFLSRCLIRIVPSLEWLSITDCIDEFSQIMEKQVDLDLEAENLIKFSKNFSKTFGVSFPRPFNNLSSSHILVESFHEGRPISDYIDVKNYELRHKLAKIGLSTVFKMIFEDNFVHCDLHPGNILVQENSNVDIKLINTSESSQYPNIVILDCGLVTELNEACRKNFFQVFKSVADGDGKKAANLIMNHSVHKTPDPKGFMDTMDDILKRHMQKGVKLENIKVGDVMSELFSAMVRYQVKQDGAFSSVILSIAVIEGLGRSLDPGIDLIRELSPFVIKYDRF